MKNIFYLLIFMFFSCKKNKKEESSFENLKNNSSIEKKSITLLKKHADDTMSFIAKCDTMALKFINTINKKKSIVTIADKPAYVYCSPSIESVVIDTLKSKTQLIVYRSIARIIPKEYSKDNQIKIVNVFYEVNEKGEIGYILKQDVDVQKTAKEIHFDYTSLNGVFNFLSFDKEGEILDSLEIESHYSDYRVNSLKGNVLSFSKEVIRFDSFRTSCPGGGSSVFISIDNKGRFKKIISSHYSTIGESQVYLPTKDEKNNTVFYQNGNPDYNSDLPITYEYLNNLNIPLEELIVEGERDYKEDVEGLSEEEIEVNSSVLNIYKWNGNELVKVKTFDRVKPKLARNNVTSYPVSDKAYTIAKNGLTYRERPEINSVKIGTFDFGTEVVIIEDSGVVIEIKDAGKILKGKWVKVKSKENRIDKKPKIGKKHIHSGYVFNGFLIDSISVKFK